MCKMNKSEKANLLNLLTKPDLIVEKLDFSEYCNRPTQYYKVSDATSEQLAFSVSPISPRMNNIARCEIILPNNKKYSRLVRMNAVFRSPMAGDIMDVYNWVKLRYLLQQTKQK